MTERPSRPGAGGRPSPLQPRAYNFPRFERHRLANGIQVVVAPAKKLPIATAIALVDAGAVCDEPGYEGLAQLTARLLLEGTRVRDGAALADGLERLGASVEVATDWDGAVVTLTALNENFAAAIGLLGELLRSPSFAEREVERLKAEHLADRMQLRAEPRGLADEMFTRFLYEPTSRFSRPEGGSEQSVSGITRAQVSAFYEARYRPGAVTLVIAGDVDAAEAVALVERTFGDWKGDAIATLQPSVTPARRHRALHVVSKPQSKQSEVRLGSVYLPRNHPDFHSSVVLNAVLGGMFTSRINLNLREKHGYTYSAFSHIDWRRQAGPFMVQTAVESDVTAPAVSEAVREIERICAERIAEDELSLATSYLAGVFPIRYETTAAIAGALAALVRYGLADNFYDTYRDRMKSVTIDDVQRVARAHLDPSAMQLVVVGDIDLVRGPLQKLAYGAMSVYDTSGQPL